MFSRSGLARAIVVSPELRVFATVVLLAWVMLLALTSLRGSNEEALTFWHIVVCCVLILPVSHVAYCVYVLPILWLWGAKALRKRAEDLKIVLVFTVMMAWWLVLTNGWPADGSSPHITALSYSVPFVAKLLALTASVLGQRLFVGTTPNRQTDLRMSGSLP